MDRRRRKSRASLIEAMVQLVGEKPYPDITIEDVTARADVARATFYAHFKDKGSLLQEATASLVADLATSVDERGPRSGTYTGGGVLVIIEHADAHRALYRLILSGEGGAPCRALLVDALEQTTTEIFSRMADASGRDPRVPLHMSILAIVGAMVLTLERWLDDQIRVDTATLAGHFVHTQMNGIGWALGYEPDEIEFRPPEALTQ